MKTDYFKFKEYFKYNEITGDIIWIKKLKYLPHLYMKKAGGVPNIWGHHKIKFNGKLYFYHRVAWLLFYGKWPSEFIDHINGDPSDNRISNLRDVSIRENGQNKTSHRNGRLVGASFHKTIKKWQSQIVIKNKKTFLGYYNTEKEASEAYFAHITKLKELGLI